MITIQQYLTASGKYPEREHHPEVTPEVLANVKILLDKVNNLLKDLNIASVIVSSGFRPFEVNAATANAAKKSLHMSGQAIDIADPKGELDLKISLRDDLKKKYDLWQEASGDVVGYPNKTPSWCHLDCKNRGQRKDNIFNP